MSADPHSQLARARDAHWEDPAGALDAAIRVFEQARTAGDAALGSRALALQGAVSLHRGDLRGAFELSAEAARDAHVDVRAEAELASLDTGIHFFTGSYGDSLLAAERAVRLADETDDVSLRLHARRMACLAFGNLGAEDWRERLDDVLSLSIAAGNRWQEAISRNDLAHWTMLSGDLDGAREQIALGLALVPDVGFAGGVLHCTRAEIALTGGDAEAGLDDATHAIALLTAGGDPNPYLLGMTVLIKVQALLALDRVEDARMAGEHALEGLGDRVPGARSMILSAVAGALREAGRAEEAYDTLARSAELEREALREFSQLQLRLERARLETLATRREADALREQADRDWLTGLHNRRYLARAQEGHSAGPVSLAVLDLDRFKSINDRFGHDTGDQVLRRIAELLVEHVRTADVVVRAGGEEFAVLMPGTPAGEAEACCERLRAVIEAERWERIAPGLTLTASVGVVSAPEATDFGALGRTADERLYAAKRGGRNRVVAV